MDSPEMLPWNEHLLDDVVAPEPAEVIKLVSALTDEDVLAALAEAGQRQDGTPTYVLRNIIAMRAHEAGDQARSRVTTREVRARLCRLERRGEVERSAPTYAVMICWRRKAQP